MVKIGKKLKGFDEGINRHDTHIGGDASQEKDTQVGNGPEKGTGQKFITLLGDHVGEHTSIEAINGRGPLEDAAANLCGSNADAEDQANPADINAYVERSGTSTLLTLLLYKVLTTKPKNVVNYITDELAILLNHELEMKEAKKDGHVERDSPKGTPSKDETDSKSNALNESDFSARYTPTQLINHKAFLGDSFITLDDLFDAVKLIKIENCDKVYFNSLLKILRPFENDQNRDILLKENVQPNECIPLNWALYLTTTFYNNCIGGASGV
ncbi:conserved Plasmodium protein, unknown function [Plasmodium vivax]|uniref:Uncharacterized protein n=6 Tax=Plasmodium vivax TaxID=5855 RepID=A5KCC3_PLAVS|nr:hypothetical protein, conserved [Plasmodium vivax]KMZ81673.1 hypothetical protein PVIIG_05039 [Plasmodium vivax India VII]KMZ87749.1 hypothetical protein PVBG_03850 [Plasmodium vivax Brazil I]KMZ94274.1 hypothetical protein PVMG_02500 [Plasmodium vivax Mauritania I]KNA00854.1 hypothetical protein PVNG_04790 [Plasmodium vivax North Korean]EDL42987.1 hypothetical protein, conserved [Plasmodium vivax]|eukprot:XP_001612714.1 hypothetical protein [Plasmodium vivax Sal-1]